MQKPFTVKSKKLTIMGTLHLPDEYKESRKKFPVVLLLHGFTGNKIEPHRFFWKISDMLAKNGVISLRFDYRGNGESEGNFEDFTIKDYIYDAKIMMKKLLKKVKKINEKNITVIGLSMGGIIASYLTSFFPEIKKIILLSAVAKPKEVFTKDLKENIPDYKNILKEKGLIDLGGIPLTKKFFDTIKRMKPLEKIKDFNGKALIIHNENDDVVSVDNGIAYKDTIANSKIKILKGSSHTFASLKEEAEVLTLIKKFI